MTGAEFEAHIVKRLNAYRKAGTADIGRYGVQAIRTSPTDIITIKSLPDFEGIIQGQPFQFIFDAKVCSQASFDLSPYRHRKKRQLEHMLRRSTYFAKCGFLIHWNERILKTKSRDALTVWFPVEQNEFWNGVEWGEIRKITWDDCVTYGKEVGWYQNRLLLLDVLQNL